ncbi:hypothetical protein ACJX0J_012919, partial [Zea mays]
MANHVLGSETCEETTLVKAVYDKDVLYDLDNPAHVYVGQRLWRKPHLGEFTQHV